MSADGGLAGQSPVFPWAHFREMRYPPPFAVQFTELHPHTWQLTPDVQTIEYTSISTIRASGS